MSPVEYLVPCFLVHLTRARTGTRPGPAVRAVAWAGATAPGGRRASRRRLFHSDVTRLALK